MGSKENLNKKSIKETVSNGIFMEKEFKVRNSVLTDLYEINHFKSIQNCFAAVVILSFLNVLICDTILGSGRIRMGFHYFLMGFNHFDYVIVIWVSMFLITLLVYPVFVFWAKVRLAMKPKSYLLKLWDYLWLVVLICYILLDFYVIPYVKGYDLPIASSAVVLSEQVRFLMKTHAYIRTNASKILAFKPHSEKNPPIPEFSKYLYFLFIPTFIYRNEYPRTEKIRWSFVIINFMEFGCGLFFFCFLTANYLEPDYKNYGLESTNWQLIAVKLFRTMLPASLFMLITFYLILHAWMNAWAEMTYFADRQFYLDWWNTNTYAAYYRKWNIVVHDYLHTYIYREFSEIIVPGNRVVATCAVFLISAIVHEYIIGFMLGFFLPVMLTQFGFFGLILMFIKVKKYPSIGNIFLWMSLAAGIGMQINTYAMEYYARINCPKDDVTFVDYFIPRILSCPK